MNGFKNLPSIFSNVTFENRAPTPKITHYLNYGIPVKKALDCIPGGSL
jgi:hypothetical protein